MKIKSHIKFKKIKEQWIKNPGFKKGFEYLDENFSFTRAIIDQRIKHGMTQKQLAEKIGTKQSAISRFESRDSNPRFSFAKRLAAGVGLKLDAVKIK